MKLFQGVNEFLRELIFFRKEGENNRVAYGELIPYSRYLIPVWRWAALGLVAGIAGSALKMVIPYSSKIFIDNIVLGSKTSTGFLKGNNIFLDTLNPLISPVITTLPGLVILLIFVGSGTVIFSLLQSYAQVRFGEEYTFQLQTDLFSHVLAFPVSYFKDQKTGYLIARMSNDTGMMQYVFSQIVIQLATQFFTLLFVLAILLAMNLHLVLILLLFVPLFFLINLFFIRRIRQIIFEGREREAYVYSDLQEIVAGIEVVKTHSAEKREFLRLAGTIRAAIRNRVKNSVYSSISNQAIYIAQGLAMLSVFWFGGQDVLAGNMSLGDFVAFSAYITLFGGTIIGIISIPQQLQPALVSANRLSKIFDLEPEWEFDGEAAKTGEKFDLKGYIEFRDVAFGYSEEKLLFQHISIDFDPGSITAIIGRTGAGKTTLMNLLLRFYSPCEGKILLDGTDISFLDPRLLRDHIALVSQDMYLFHASIEHNIRYSKPSASIDEIREAAKKAGIDKDIMSMSDGYQTIVGERGTKISSGQRQRISIARAFLKDARILILDEPTSHLDRETEIQLEETLKILSEGKTTILITHRHSLLEIADVVYKLDNGTLERFKSI